jgi:phage terminase large subunit GpA-like protein
MPVADAVKDYMRVPMGQELRSMGSESGTYVIEPMNCLASREYDAVVFVGPARTGKTIGLIDGWIVYNIVCDPAICSLFRYPKRRRASIQKTPGSYFPLQPRSQNPTQPAA